tara:strand:+ start:433 stop:996 length:564 start_codon:yes stop_codon:yes gene_type:complete
MPPKEVLKKKRKKWYPILASPELRNAEIGETTTIDADSLIGRTITVNLMSLTNDFKNQNVKITFKINKIQDDRAFTEFKAYTLLQTAVRRLAQREKNKIEDSFNCTTKDQIKVKIKPVFVTKTQTQKSVLTLLRKKAREFFEIYSKKNNYSTLISDVVSFRLQIGLRNSLKKTYPITACQIKALIKE